MGSCCKGPGYASPLVSPQKRRGNAACWHGGCSGCDDALRPAGVVRAIAARLPTRHPWIAGDVQAPEARMQAPEAPEAHRYDFRSPRHAPPRAQEAMRSGEREKLLYVPAIIPDQV